MTYETRDYDEHIPTERENRLQELKILIRKNSWDAHLYQSEIDYLLALKTTYNPNPAHKHYWDKYGSECWTVDGLLHRDEKDPYANHLTLPAKISVYGKNRTKELVWYRNGEKQLKPLDKYITTKQWYKNGKLHRDDKDSVTGLTLPAMIDVTGSQRWFKNGLLHRDDKDSNGKILPAVIYADGIKEWYINGEKQIIFNHVKNENESLPSEEIIDRQKPVRNTDDIEERDYQYFKKLMMKHNLSHQTTHHCYYDVDLFKFWFIRNENNNNKRYPSYTC